MRAGDHAGGRFVGRKASAEREAAADALGDAHDIRRNAGPFMREKAAGAADAALDFVEDQQKAVVVADGAQRPQEFRIDRAHAALALHGLDEDAGGRLGDSGLDRIEIAKRHLVEAGGLGAEAFDIFLIAAGRDRRRRATMEGTVEGDDVELFRVSLVEVIAARRLDGAFDRFGTGIGEEDLVGKGVGDETAGQTLLARSLIEVRRVPELFGLGLQRFDQMGMRMAQRIHGHTGCEIEISLAVFRNEPDALAALETERRTGITVIKRRGFGHGASLLWSCRRRE